MHLELRGTEPRTATAQAWECNGALISELAMRKITQRLRREISRHPAPRPVAEKEHWRRK
ncbi:MAG: hypothetical protein ACLSHU_11580 [Oscillospiraceae bacterium]